MRQHRRQPGRIPPFVNRLFLPARWCRRQWPHLWFKGLSALAALAMLLSAFGPWGAHMNKRSWENWLENFQSFGSGARNPHARFGRERRRELRDTEPLPAYLGEGKAELGEFSIRVFDPITQGELRTDFRLKGTTNLGDEASFAHFMRGNRRFLREQVAVVLRTHNLDELADPDLNLLGRKIVARVNRSLGKRVLKSAEIRDFALYESIDRSSFALWEPDLGEGVP